MVGGVAGCPRAVHRGRRGPAAQRALGAPQRNAGLLAWALAAGAFVLGASTGGLARPLRWTARAATIGAALVGTGAVLDRLGVDVFGLGDLDGLTRARSTWGSATFAAGYLVLVGPIAVVHLQAEDRRWHAVGAVACVAAGIGLVLTGTRGAWLGAVVAAGIVAWPHRAPRGAGGWRRVAPLAAMVVLAIALVGAISSPSLGRSTAAGRLDLWRVSAAAAVDRPILGSGPDTQRIVVPASIDDAFEREHGSEEIHDRAHTLVLDTLLTTGVVGLVALGALLVAVGRGLVVAGALRCRGPRAGRRRGRVPRAPADRLLRGDPRPLGLAAGRHRRRGGPGRRS